MVKIALKTLGRIITSSIIAFAILTLFSYFYYNTPPSRANNDGSTDYKWEANRFYSRGTEGFGLGKTNNDGFVNMFDYNDMIDIDILIMGGSYMQAFEVKMSQSTANRLNSLLKDKTVYNIGIAEHSLLTCANNFRAALNKYHPTKYVIIETSSVSFSDEEIALALQEEIPKIKSFDYDDRIRDLLRRNPYLRLINYQIILYERFQAKNMAETEAPESFVESDTISNENLLNDLLLKMSMSAKEYGVKIIIAYHPKIDIAWDGAINLDVDQNTIAQFKRLCNNSGILFLDMSDRFKEEYKSAYILPYGFSNSPVGTGHLNKYGHAMLADELCALISEDEQ